MTFSERIKAIDKKLTETTKDVKFSSWFPLLLYMLTFYLIDFFAFFTIFPSRNVPVELYFGRVSISYIILGSALFFFFRKKLSLIFYSISALFLITYEFAEMCYASANKSLFRLSVVTAAKDGFNYAETALRAIPLRIWAGYAVLIAFVVLTVILTAKFGYEPQTKVSARFKLILSGAAVILSIVFVIFIKPFMLSSGQMENFGSFDIYNYTNLVDAETMFRRDDLLMLLNRDAVCSVKQRFTSAKYEKEIDSFLEDRPSHTDNEMTGIFKGKNLVLVQMETFENQLITEELCPNLYKLRQNSIDLEKFYASRFGDTYTFGTELAMNTGLFAPAGASIESDFTQNAFPYTLASQLSSQGYTAREYHFNTGHFYNRGNMHKTFGYEDYVMYANYADDKSLMFEIDDTLINDDGIYNKLIEKQPFLDFIVTYSAHCPYIQDDIYKEAVRRRPELAADDEVGIYKAKATLTDDMVGRLIERFEEDGLMDNTVFVFYGDHHNPYIMTDDELEEDCSNIPCFIYCKGVDGKKVSKYCSTINILPTLANMFGLDICDSCFAQDVFDPNYDSLVYFQNLAWIDDKYHYNGSEVIESFSGEVPDAEYIKKRNEEVKQRININNYILFLDYYKKH